MSKNIVFRVVSIICALCLVLVGVGMSFDASRMLGKQVSKREIETIELYKTEPIVNREELPYVEIEEPAPEPEPVSVQESSQPVRTTPVTPSKEESSEASSKPEPSASSQSSKPQSSSSSETPSTSEYSAPDPDVDTSNTEPISSSVPESSSKPESSKPEESSSSSTPSESSKPDVSSEPSSSSSSSPSSSSSQPDPQPEPEPDPTPTPDPSRPTLIVIQNGQQVKVDAQAALERFVASEMYPSWNIEALKAQAVASHTYVKYYNDVLNKAVALPNPSASNITARVKEAVAAVYREIITLGNGQPINALYTAATAGSTRSSADTYGGSFSYLTEVESKYDSQDASNWDKVTYLKVSDVKRYLQNSTGLTLGDDPNAWITIDSHTAGGYVGNVTVHGTNGSRTYRSNYFKESVIANKLRSTWFTFEVSGDNFIFTTRGYGHSVGMSQWGAQLYAKNEGWSYRQILSHYYKGTTIQ